MLRRILAFVALMCVLGPAACASEESSKSATDPTQVVEHELPTTCGGGMETECLEQSETAVSFDKHTGFGVEKVAVKDGNVLLELKPGVELPNKIQAGAVIFRTPKLGRPGFLRKIDSVQRNGNQVLIQTSPATLKEAFPKGRIRRKVSISAEMLKQAFEAQQASGATGASGQPLTIGFNDCSGTIFNSQFKGVDIDVSLQQCSVTFTPDIELYIHWGGLLPDEITAIASGAFDAKFKALAKLSAAVTHAKEIRLLTIAVPIPAIASTIEMTVNAGYHLDANAMLEVTSGFETDAKIDVGFRWENGNAVEEIWDPVSNYTPIPTTFAMEGSADGEIYLRPQIALKFLGSAGPTLDLKAYLGLNAYSRKFGEVETSPGVYTTDHDVCYELVAGLQPNLGVEVSILGISLLSESFALTTLETMLVDECLSYQTVNNTTGCPVPTECVTAEDCGSSELTCKLYTCSSDCKCNSWDAAFCCKTNADCDDADICTADVCHATGGTCSYAPIYGCCRNDAECDDGLPHTFDSCDANNKCQHDKSSGDVDCNTVMCCTTDADCGDGNPLTQDTCGADGICVHKDTIQGGKK